MKISSEIIKEIISAVKSNGISEEVESPEGVVKAYFIEDVTASFIQKEKGVSFYGLSFEAIGKDFTVLPTLQILISLPNEEGTEDEPYEITDENTVKVLEEYLSWRAKVLTTLNF